MSSFTVPNSPIPQQDELLPVDISVLLAEYQQAFKSDSVYLPEVALRYLFLLISSDDPCIEDIKLFSNQMRLELNKQRLERLKLSFFNIGIDDA